MMRTNMMNNTGRTPVLKGGLAFGKVRAGMHLRDETAYRRFLSEKYLDEEETTPEILEDVVNPDTEPEEETSEEALDMPNELEAMIPEEDEPGEVQLSAAGFSNRTKLDVDWVNELVPVMAPVTGGVNCEPTELVYDSGDGEVHMIPDPLGVLSDEGIHPFFPEIKNPSANVPA